jgi:Tat protein secretion system quality control protein TatD with DNase activity
MLVDSHCHLNFPELADNMPDIRQAMTDHHVGHALCISVNLREYPQVLAVADAYDNFYATVGVHPDYEDEPPLSVDQLVELAKNPKVGGIGETGLLSPHGRPRVAARAFQSSYQGSHPSWQAIDYSYPVSSRRYPAHHARRKS